MDGWKFSRLVHALRQVAIDVSSQDILEAQICLLRFPDLAEKRILRSIFIHRPQDSLIFDMVWIILSGDQNPLAEDFDTGELKNPIFEANQNSLGIGGQGAGQGAGGSSLTVKGDMAHFSQLATQISVSRMEEFVSSGSDYEEVVQKILADINYYAWINSFDLFYQRGRVTDEQWHTHQAYRNSLVHEIRQRALAVQVSHENSWEPLVRQHWWFKPLNKLSEPEKDLVKSSIRKWARKLAVRPGSLMKISHRGIIDIPRIVSQSVQWDGLFFRLSYRQRVPRASELVVMCDVSNSMAAYVEFLIYLVTCLRVRFRKIRVFFFIDTLWDVSEFVWDDDLNGAKQEIQSWGHKVSSGFSDYGTVFRELAENCLDEVSSRATLVILGDGKNNYRPAQTEYLVSISEKVRNVVWLNPLDPEEWAEPDNMMREYQAYCSRVYRCRTASDLQSVVRDVF